MAHTPEQYQSTQTPVTCNVADAYKHQLLQTGFNNSNNFKITLLQQCKHISKKRLIVERNFLEALTFLLVIFSCVTIAHKTDTNNISSHLLDKTSHI